MTKKRIREVTLLVALFVLLQASLVTFAKGPGDGIQPLLDNAKGVAVTLGFSNNIANCTVIGSENTHTTRISGYLILNDVTTGSEVSTWYVVMQGAPFIANRTHSVTPGHKYELTFSGYVYGSAGPSEYISLTTTATN